MTQLMNQQKRNRSPMDMLMFTMGDGHQRKISVVKDRFEIIPEPIPGHSAL